MVKHFTKENVQSTKPVNCGTNPTESLVEMFVNQIQKGRIDIGQCPAMRPVFLKAHNVVKGVFKVNPDLPENLRVGLFAGKDYSLWARFSSDTLPDYSDFKTTCGVGLKLFDTPTPKIFGLPEETTFDFIMQNFPVFFVDTARDMCEFTRAGVVNKNYQPYLDSHPETARILDEMAKPVGSALAIAYWGILPFSLGKDQYVKYMLKPRLKDKPSHQQPANPTYLAQDMANRLATEDVYFDFCVQLRTNPDSMPLDQAMVEWPESDSPFVPIAEVQFPKQDINARGQAEYGENLSFNIWRVTEDHKPQGSIAGARRDVYAASAEQRRNANGIPDGEPVSPKPDRAIPPCKDEVIVRAAIHPGIGVARVGNAETGYFIGPEVTDPKPDEYGFYRTPENALKRQAARFRIYGYNAAGEVVSELTSDNADINWQVHVANRKADWFHFIQAMDIPESSDLVIKRRNKDIKGTDRKELVIDPGTREITGSSTSGPEYCFDSGTFKGKKVYLGELQTDNQGCLIFLGGHGKSASPSHQPPYLVEDPDSFNNAPDWYDDMSDGPVNARVAINGRTIPVEGAWVVTTPPNYAPELTSWRTMYDLMVDVYTKNGWLSVPNTTIFTRDVLPFLKRFSNLQWVNKGFAAMFGKGRPMDFSNTGFITQLAQTPKSVVSPATGERVVIDPYGELRRQLLNSFRPFQPTVNDPRLWPWLYGDDFGNDLFSDTPNTMLALPSLQQMHLQRWADGLFENDWKPDYEPARTLSQVPLAEQPEMLDRAAMTFCLADAFHPGCELTWPMRHASLYHKPFRIRQSSVQESPDQWGATLNQEQALAPDGPVYAQVAGGITRWMGIPWQGDTAYCRSGYDLDYDLYLPSFWPARVPNTVLTEEAYQIVMDDTQPRDIRVASYNQRASWNRFVDQPLDDGGDPDIAKVMERMIAEFSAQGIIEARPGINDDPDFPEVIYVENNAYKESVDQLKNTLLLQSTAPATTQPASQEDKLRQAGWASERQWKNAVRLRQRKRTEDR